MQKKLFQIIKSALYFFFFIFVLICLVLLILILLPLIQSVFLSSIKITLSNSDQLKTAIDELRVFTETIAIVVAGIWTYNRFIKGKEETREDYPYPKIEQKIRHYRLGNGKTYLSVFVKITNKGKRMLDLSKGMIRLRQILPMSGEIANSLREHVSISDEQGDRNFLSQNVQKTMRKSKKIHSYDPNQQGIRDIDAEIFTDSGQRIKWNTIDSVEWKHLRGNLLMLEPEQEKEFLFDFLVDNDVELVVVISYFAYEQRGWEVATLYSIVDENG